MLEYYVMWAQTPPIHPRNAYHILTELSMWIECVELGRNRFGDLEQHGTVDWVPNKYKIRIQKEADNIRFYGKNA